MIRAMSASTQRITEALISREAVSVHIDGLYAMDAITKVVHGTGLVAILAPDGETVIVRPQSNLSSTATRASNT